MGTGEDGGRQQEIEDQVMDGHDATVGNQGAPFAPPRYQSQGGKKVHMHVDLKNLPLAGRYQEADQAGHGHGRHDTGRGAGAILPPHGRCPASQNGSAHDLGQKSRTFRDQARRRDQSHVQPQKGDEHRTETKAKVNGGPA